MLQFNLLTPNDDYSGRTTPLTSKCCILYIYSTNRGTEYFKHAIYSPFFFSSKCSLFHKSNVFNSCIIHILYTGCAKIKKNNSGAKRLIFNPKLTYGCQSCRSRGIKISIFIQYIITHYLSTIFTRTQDEIFRNSSSKKYKVAL